MTLAENDVSVIICVYTEDRWDEFVAAIASLRRQTHLPREIIVVVDHNPHLFARIHAYLSDIVLVENSASRGLSGARNTGLALAHGTLVAFLDDDAEAEPEWLALLVRCCAEPFVLGAGGTVVPRWHGTEPMWFPREFYWVIGCTYQTPPKHVSVVRNPYGGCTCIKREVFQTTGGFREGIGRIGTDTMGGEETELSIRATHYWPEKVFLYEPRARIHHHIPTHRMRWRYFLARCYAEGLSKALVSRYVGTKDSLSSERTYTLRTLPQGIQHGLTDLLLHQRIDGLMKATAIIAGLSSTVAGFCAGHFFSYLPKARRGLVKDSINDSSSASLLG